MRALPRRRTGTLEAIHRGCMIRVGIVTTHAPEKCGVATYSQELMRHMIAPDATFKVIGRPFTPHSIGAEIHDVDIIHINHVWSLFGAITQLDVERWKQQGKKVMCTFNESTTENRSAFTLSFDRVIVHQRTVDGFTYIPHGLLNQSIVPTAQNYGFVGTAGFPMGFKNYAMIAAAAKTVGLKLLAFAPESPHADAGEVYHAVHSACPGSHVNTEFRSHGEIIQALSACLCTVFPHAHAGGGISGSVRMGVSARRPVVISSAGRFTDFITEYPDEFYVIPNGNPSRDDVAQMLRQVRSDVEAGCERVPDRVIHDMDWSRIAEQYVRIYKELMA